MIAHRPYQAFRILTPLPKDGGCTVEKNTLESGFALIATLWVMAILGVIGASLAFEAQCESKAEAWAVKTRRAYNLARAGVHMTAGLVREHYADKSHSLHDKWISGPDNYRQVKFDNGYYTILRRGQESMTGQDSSGSMLDEKTREPRFGLDDEESRLNINTLFFEQIARLPEVSKTLAADIVQFIADRKKEFERTNLKRRDEGLPEITDRDGLVTMPVRNIADLLEVKGMTEKILYGPPDNPGGIALLLTCFSSGKVNINTASPEVLRILGFTEQNVNFITEYRWGKREGFTSVDEVTTMLGIKSAELQKMLATTSANFRINCIAGFSPDKMEERIQARLSVGSEKMRFTAWESETLGLKPAKDI